MRKIHLLKDALKSGYGFFFITAMLSKIYRLTKKGSFRYVYNSGMVCSDKIVTLAFVAGKNVKRIGFIVSNKIGKAVVRNKVKRRMRAVIGGYLSDIKGCQAVFTARGGIEKLEYKDIKAAMTKLLVRSKLLPEAERNAGVEKEEKQV